MKQALHLITELSTGGAQQALYRLLSAMDRNRYNPTVVCLFNGDGAIAHQIRQLDIEVIDLGMDHAWRLDALWRLHRLLRHRSLDILHCWMIHANLFGRVVGWAAGVPIIVTSRRNVEIGGAFRERLKRWTVSFDDRIIAVCEAARRAEIDRAGAPPDKVVTIHNGIDLDRFTSITQQERAQLRQSFGCEDNTPLLIVVARLHPQKGHAYLLQAVAMLQRSAKPCRLLIVGDGELCGALKAEARRLGIDGQVLFAGNRKDIPTLLAAADLFVLPSLWEGLPNVVLEAMAARLAVVATDVGGTPEVVVHDETGLLVPLADAPALAQAIQQLIADPEQRCQMGAAGRMRVEQSFTVRQMVEKTQALYDELLIS